LPSEYVLKTGTTARGSSAKASPSEISTTDGFAVKLGIGAFVAVPITSPEGDVMGVIQVTRSSGNVIEFCDKDVHELENFMPFCHAAIANAETLASAVLECKWSNVLLDLSKNLFENLESQDSLISKIMVNAAALLSCEVRQSLSHPPTPTHCRACIGSLFG
jgi:hypothetical protein